ncbi:hypothetical protein [Companilactobacillus zhachilii]|uniref:hypothetical protein n=1 Tax=Companilactobacillus zhachilii TaxID=2304606 RepID=UPI0040346CAF
MCVKPKSTLAPQFAQFTKSPALAIGTIFQSGCLDLILEYVFFFTIALIFFTLTSEQYSIGHRLCPLHFVVIQQTLATIQK